MYESHLSEIISMTFEWNSLCVSLSQCPLYGPKWIQLLGWICLYNVLSVTSVMFCLSPLYSTLSSSAWWTWRTCWTLLPLWTWWTRLTSWTWWTCWKWLTKFTCGNGWHGEHGEHGFLLKCWFIQSVLN